MWKINKCIKKDIFSSILHTDWQSISAYHSGDLMARITSDISLVSGGIVNIVPDVLALTAQIIASFVVLLQLDSTFAICALIIGSMILLISRLYSRWIKKLHVACQESESLVRTILHEALQNLVLIKSFRSERRSTQQVEGALKRNFDHQIIKNRYGVFANILLSLGFLFCIRTSGKFTFFRNHTGKHCIWQAGSIHERDSVMCSRGMRRRFHPAAASRIPNSDRGAGIRVVGGPGATDCHCPCTFDGCADIAFGRGNLSHR